jgi:hypothetical protein
VHGNRKSQQLVSEPDFSCNGWSCHFSAKFDVMKFDGTGNFRLWQQHVKDLLVQQGMVGSVRLIPTTTWILNL